jgi:quercetin dioxygenase-like cupin family protein
MTVQSTSAGIVFRHSPARALAVVGEQVTPVVDSSDGATSYEVFDMTGPEGSGPPPHNHPWDESYLVLDGELAVVDWTSGLESPREEVLTPGGSAFIPGGATHSFRVRSDSCRFVVVTTPGALAFFSDADATLGGPTDDLDLLVAVAKRNGLSSPLFPA